MINKEIVKYSLRNIKHNKSRNLLTIFSIFVGIVTITIFVSFGVGLYNYVDEITSDSSYDKIMIQIKGFGVPDSSSAFILDENDLEAVERAGGVYEAGGIGVESVKVDFRGEFKYVYLMSYDPKKDFVLSVFAMEIDTGRNLLPGDSGSVVLGYNYKIPGKIFDNAFEINDKILINGENFRVVGFFEEVGSSQDDSQIYISEKDYSDLFDKNISYSYIVARVDIENYERTISNVENNLRKERNQEKGEEDFFVQSFDEMIESYQVIFNVIIGFVFLIALISIFVSAINTANTMVTSVLERYKEVGVLKAVGAKNVQIFGIFLFESSFLGFVAGVFGFFVGWILSSIGAEIVKGLGLGFLQPAFPFWLILGVVLFSTGTGAISGVLPAIKASRINTVDALRYE